MQVARRLALGLTGLASVLFSLDRASAEAPAWKKEATALFESGWRAGAEAQTEAEERYQAARRVAGNDPRLAHAWALVLIKQRRHDAAVEHLDGILKQDPGNLVALAWKVRLNLHTSKKYPAAAVDMEQMAMVAATAFAHAKDAPQKSDALAAARFLGRAFGFLEGPAGYSANQRDELKASLEQLLSGDLLAAFETGRNGVSEKFKNFQAQGEQHRAEDQQKEQDDKKLQQEQVDAKRADLDQETKDLAAERSKLREDQRRELADISREARQADTDASQAETRLATVLRQWNLLVSERDRWLIAMDAERDPTRREIFRNEAARIDISLGTLDGERRVREGDVLRARARRVEVEGSRREAQRRFKTALAGIDKREDAVKKGANRLGAEQKKIDKPVSNTSNRQRNLNARAGVFATYDDPPLEIEKARILSSLK